MVREVAVDPITLEVIRNAFIGSADEMKINLTRTSYNPIIYEVLDFSVGLFNRDGDMIAQAAGLPIFLGNLAAAIKTVLADVGAERLAPGDIYLINDTYTTGTHLNDMTVITPVFHDDRLVGFTGSRAHWLDLGSKDPGGWSPDATEIFQEGLRFRSIPLYRRGEANEAVMRILRDNVRLADTVMGDLRAQIAAGRTGERRFTEVMERFGATTVTAAIGEILRQGEVLARRAVAAMPDGVYEAEAFLDDDGVGTEHLTVRVTVTIDGDRMVVDLAGSHPQLPGPLNCGYAATVSGARIAFKCLTTPFEPVNEGHFVPLDVRVPDDCMFNARMPAPAGIYGLILMTLCDVIVAALAPAVPDRVPAAHYCDVCAVFMSGTDPRTGRPYLHVEPEGGGWGAGPHGDGENVLIAIADGDTRNVPVEIIEHRYPLRVERYEVRQDSGGPGRFRGGLGHFRDYRILGHRARLTTTQERSQCPPWGLFGGRPAAVNTLVINPREPGERVIQKCTVLPVEPGDLISVRTGGGGRLRPSVRARPRGRAPGRGPRVCQPGGSPARLRRRPPPGYARAGRGRDPAAAGGAHRSRPVAAVTVRPRRSRRAAPPVSTPVPRGDPFEVEVIREALRTISEEMFVAQGRVSQSPIIYEVLDYACGLTDPTGSLIAQGQGVTGFLGTLSAAVQETLSKFGRQLGPGDVVATNDPYAGGGTHPSDVTLVAPLFYEGELVAFAASKAHWTEVGGKDPGSWTTDATEVYQEGLLLPCVKLLASGSPVDGLLELIAANVRLPEMTLGDLWASVAALRIAERRVGEICRRFGTATVRAAMGHLLDHSERLARLELRKLPPGRYRAEDWVDDDGIGNGPFPVHVQVTITPDRFVCNFIGTHPQVPGPINSTWTTLLGSVRQAFLGVAGPHLPVNDGCFRPVEVVCPPGTLFTARRPAPVSTYWETDAFATDLIWKALAPALPERVTAGHFLSVCGTIVSGQHPDSGQLFLLVEPQPGGWGGGFDKDGESGLVCSGDGETYVVPIEVCEARYGIQVEQFAFAIESGGAGQFRGGRGIVREYRVLANDAFLTVTFGRNRFLPWGVAGGRDGSPNYVEVCHADGRRVRFGKCARYPLRRDDRVRLVTGTGGGWGDPGCRDPDRVREDLRNAVITEDQAQRDYAHALRSKGSCA